MKPKNPCKDCQHYWQCIDRDREMLCNLFISVEGENHEKDHDSGKREGR